MQRHAILDISCRTLWGRSFLEAVAAKAEDSVDEWIRALSCPVLRVDGTRPVRENVAFLAGQLERKLP